ncbi:MAG: DNA alkylation repair protein [Phycisphaerales bacterium]|nr:MAG: DNA alkylation repair protein [Phycisphaerales bacterium]
MAQKLKDMFFTSSSIDAMANVLKRFYPGFDKRKFSTLVFDEGFDSKELKAKMRHTTECLRQTLPKSYKGALSILKRAASFVEGFEAMCLPDFVELYGLDDWDLSLDALALFTKFSSSEFAIRPFIIREPKRAMTFMEELAKDKDPNVRRFASEGCRPRLPWAMAIPAFKKEPSLILPILEKLKDDNSEFVRKSVANNLNDISKDHPELVLDVCKRWFGKSKNTDWIVKHACRTMLKAGDRRAMLLFGFGDPKHISVEELAFDRRRLTRGEHVRFTFTLRVGTKRTCKIRLEYAVYFARAKGKVSKKVFKITENTFARGEHTVTRKHSFADMPTRKHHPGKHQITIIVNGVQKAQKCLTLTK